MKILIILFTFCFNNYAKSEYSPSRLSRLSGEKSYKYNSKSQWDQAYARQSYIFGKAPAKFLAENYSYLPENSKVLDMGMGEGRNAVFLAQKGHRVIGIDISSVAIKKANKLAKEFGVRVQSVLASLDTYKVKKGSLDGIICFYYVDRKLIPKMISWLKPGGVIFFEADSIKQKKQKGQKTYSEEQYLKEGELLTLFPDMRVLKYEEPLHEDKFRASIIVQKRKK
jgi:2-polyprenyl-3-methyl-5-hydroxy-6-metoxy-1,4-benzoquinol methylase